MEKHRKLVLVFRNDDPIPRRVDPKQLESAESMESLPAVEHGAYDGALLRQETINSHRNLPPYLPAFLSRDCSLPGATYCGKFSLESRHRNCFPSFLGRVSGSY